MNQKPFIGAYWAARKETHQESVARTLQFLDAISQESRLARWFIPGNTRKEANTPQQISLEAIGKRMKPIGKRCRGIPDPELTDRLGFRFSAWNGSDDASAGLSVTCGLHVPNQNNSIVLDLPLQPFPGDQESRNRFKRLLDIFVKIWEPDFAIVTSSTRLDHFLDDKDALTKSAWLLYRRGQPLVVNPIVES